MQGLSYFRKMNFEKAKAFSVELEEMNPPKICSGYPLVYLEHLLNHKEYYLDIYTRVFGEILKKSGKKAEEVSIVDYGCGNGLLGCFAMFCGFGNVIFQDVDPEFLNSSKALAKGLHLNDGIYIPGEIENLREQRLRIDAVAGTDVIEHIYDLDNFFSVLQELNAEMISVFTTAANPFNPFIVNRLKQLHRKDEFIGNDGSGLSGKPHLPFLEIRKKIISSNFPRLKNIEEMSRATRGLKELDILNAVKNYELTNRLPQPAPNFNTCHPLTGSWTERILSEEEYKKLYSKYGFRIEIIPGFYNNYSTGLKAGKSFLLNTLVALLGKTFSPFIIITGYKK